MENKQTIIISKDLYIKLTDTLCQILDEEFDIADGESEKYKAINKLLKDAYEETKIIPMVS